MTTYATAKLLTITKPWQNADRALKYLLVPKGCTPPPGIEADQIISVPVHSMVSLSATNLSYLDQLGVLDHLVGVGDLRLIYNPKVIEKANQGKIKEVGWSASVDTERLLSLNADLVLTFATGQSRLDGLVDLDKFNIPYVLIADYMESTPLGRAEWIKAIASFFGKEELADRLFSDIERQYLNLAKQTRTLKDKPTVLTGSQFHGTWHVPGGKNYFARLLRDAGVDYIWSSDESRGSLPLDFETVYARAWNADYWLNPGNFRDIDELISANDHYGLFTAVKNRAVYNNNARINQQGGNDFWESGLVNPQLLLADLVKIFHPQLLPQHRLIWYRRLE